MFAKFNNTVCLIVFLSCLLSCSKQNGNIRSNSTRIEQPTIPGQIVPAENIKPPLVSTLTETTRLTIGKPKVIKKKDSSVSVKGGIDFKVKPSSKVILKTIDPNFPNASPITSKPKQSSPPQVIPANSTWRTTFGRSIIFNEKDGFPTSNIGAMLQDKEGNIWGCSRFGGAVKYDGYNFSLFNQRSGLVDYSVVDMFCDRDGDIWFGMSTALAKFDGKHFTTYTGENEISKVKPTKFAEDAEGNIWVGSSEGLYKINKAANTITHFTGESGLLQKNISGLHKDQEGNIWITYNEVGMSILSISAKNDQDLYTFNHYQTDSLFKLHNVQCLYTDTHGQVYIGTDLELIQFDKNSFNQKSELYGRHYQNSSLGIGFIYDMEEDHRGQLWVANFPNPAYVELNHDGRFSHISFLDDDKIALASDHTLSLTRDKDNNIWLGHANSAITKIDLDNPYKSHLDDFGISGKIPKVLEDENQNIWFAIQYEGVFCLKKDTMSGEETLLKYVDHKEQYVNMYFDMEFDQDGNLWMICNSTLSKFHLPNNKSDGYLINYASDLWEGTSVLTNLMIDNDGKLWMAESMYDPFDKILSAKPGGVLTWDEENLFKYGKEQGLLGHDVQHLCQDLEGNFWFSTEHVGLTKYVPGKNAKWFHFLSGPFLPTPYYVGASSDGGIWVMGNDSLLHFSSLGEDDQFKENLIPLNEYSPARQRTAPIENKLDILWMGTKHGIEKVALKRTNTGPEIVNARSINSQDGFLGGFLMDQYEASNGTIWTGGVLGLVSFDPSEIEAQKRKNVIHKSRAFLFDEEIKVEKISDLSYTENYLSFDINIVEVDQPHIVKYRHILEGYESNWSRPISNTTITYPNLPHGNFTLKVQSKMVDGSWSEPYIEKINIKPPWWFSNVAYCLYGLILGAIVYTIWRVQLNWIHQKNIIEKEQMAAANLREIDEVKTQFFTNLSHEYRTPLTVILGMAEEIKEDGLPKKLIRQSGKNLLRLVNQMLDFSKMEAGKLRLNLKTGELVSYIQYLLESYQSLAEHKKIQLIFESSLKELKIDFDESKIQHVVANLISNAIKFTAIGGEVKLRLTEHENQLSIEVYDSGIGIASDKLPFIFDRFFQIKHSIGQGDPGSGIGLSFTKELTDLMGGEILVRSKLGEGSVFQVLLPMTKATGLISLENNDDPLNQILINRSVVPENDSNVPSAETDIEAAAQDQKPQLLVIEDNPEVVLYIQSVLTNIYQITIAEDGKIGVEKALALIPDIIISDVMMPFKNGFEVTDMLKNDERTSHIPILLLTAKVDIESKLEGLKRGADAYLAKPFDKNELKIRLLNMIELRRKLQSRYAQTSSVNMETMKNVGTDVDISSMLEVEDVFLAKVNDLIEINMEDAGFLVDELSNAVGMDRSQLYRKLKALTNKSTVAYLRSRRLQKAKELLSEQALNVSEIAFKVGFSDPSYFTRVFTKEYGMKPSEV